MYIYTATGPFWACEATGFHNVTLNNTVLQYKDEAIHLGHVLSFDFNDITRALKDFNRKANCVLCTFHAADCFVKCFLVKLYCLSLYGCCLWHLGSLSLCSLQIAMNKVMRKVWHLPYRAHVPIVARFIILV